MRLALARSPAPAPGRAEGAHPSSRPAFLAADERLDLEDGRWEDVHVITGALKLFFRELPEPLFPFSHFRQFIAAISEWGGAEGWGCSRPAGAGPRAPCVPLAEPTLPFARAAGPGPAQPPCAQPGAHAARPQPGHHAAPLPAPVPVSGRRGDGGAGPAGTPTLSHRCALIPSTPCRCRVIEYGEQNRMSVQSVAIVFGPTLLRPETEEASMPMTMVFQNQVVELILQQCSDIFPPR